MSENSIKEPGGVLIVNKPTGITSHDMVRMVRKLYGTKRVGHAGTLDPMASGVLVVLVGRAAKATEYISAAGKKYRAVMRLGLTTDTLKIVAHKAPQVYTPFSKGVSETTLADGICTVLLPKDTAYAILRFEK